MAALTWRFLAGDTASFALELNLLDNDGHDEAVDADDRASWGSFAIWVQGRNLCAHTEEGETLEAAHWYLLPFLEWMAENWDPLLHEERLLRSRTGPDAASSMRASEQATLASETAQWSWMERWQGWWARHNLREASAGGLFPDLYIRRWGDEIEFSLGGEPAPGAPGHFAFLVQEGRFFARSETVAAVLHRVARAAVDELRARRPASVRLQQLASLYDVLTDAAARQRRRLAWLSGSGEDQERFERLWKDVDQALDDHELSTAERDDLTGSREADLVVAEAPQLALLFGSYSPHISQNDVMALLELARLNQGGPQIRDAAIPLLTSLDDLAGLSPGEQGSLLGDELYESLGLEGPPVDVAGVLSALQVATTDVALEDSSVRGVSLLSGAASAVAAVNRAFRHGTSEPVVRFTLAHELAHLLLDRGRARRLAVASGPWAPRDVEQRANAFAAALLMPSKLLLPAVASLAEAPEALTSIVGLVRAFGVSASSLADRLYNLQILDREQADAIRGQAAVGKDFEGTQN